MNIRKVRDELASLRPKSRKARRRQAKEVEETPAAPLVVGPSGYADQEAGPPVVLGRLPGMVVMVDPRDAGL